MRLAGDASRLEKPMRTADAIPKMTDLSRSGRTRFLDEWEAQLWAFWREALWIEIGGGEIDPQLALGLKWNGDEHDAASEIADRLIDRLRKRPTLAKARPWTDVRGWFVWLVGGQAVRAKRSLEGSLPAQGARHSTQDPGSAETPEVQDDDDVRKTVLDLVADWTETLRRVVTGTKIAAIELDWLWATCPARQPLAKYLGELGAQIQNQAAHWVETSRKKLVKATAVPGTSRGERIERSRAGAAACFRFNLEEWTPTSPELAKAHGVFLDAARIDPPYRPLVEPDEEGLVGFREVLRRSIGRDETAGERDLVARLRADVARGAVKKSVARLLPRKEEQRLLHEWPALIGEEVDQ